MRPYGIGILDEIVALRQRDPNGNDDRKFGYARGQFWINTTTLLAFQCMRDLPLGNAVWTQIAGSGSSNLIWRGPWSAAAVYTKDDLVFYLSSAFIALQSNQNAPPSGLAPNWDMVAQGGDPGPIGPPGPVGPPGPPGPINGFTQAEADLLYRQKPSIIHSQGLASSVWTIAHNLGTYPAVTIKDSTGAVVEADVQYVDGNSLIVSMAYPVSGTALLT